MPVDPSPPSPLVPTPAPESYSDIRSEAGGSGCSLKITRVMIGSINLTSNYIASYTLQPRRIIIYMGV